MNTGFTVINCCTQALVHLHGSQDTAFNYIRNSKAGLNTISCFTEQGCGIGKAPCSHALFNEDEQVLTQCVIEMLAFS